MERVVELAQQRSTREDHPRNVAATRHMKQKRLLRAGLHSFIFRNVYANRAIPVKNLFLGMIARPHKLFLRKITRQYNRINNYEIDKGDH